MNRIVRIALHKCMFNKASNIWLAYVTPSEARILWALGATPLVDSLRNEMLIGLKLGLGNRILWRFKPSHALLLLIGDKQR